MINTYMLCDQILLMAGPLLFAVLGIIAELYEDEKNRRK